MTSNSSKQRGKRRTGQGCRKTKMNRKIKDKMETTLKKINEYNMKWLSLYLVKNTC